VKQPGAAVVIIQPTAFRAYPQVFLFIFGNAADDIVVEEAGLILFCE
jgi:hypothetical protein